MSIEDTIKRMKDAIGVKSDRQLAQALNISPSAVTEWKRYGNVPIANISRISELSGKSIESIQKGFSDISTDNIKLHYYPNISASAGYDISNEDDSRELLETSRPFLAALGLRVFKNLDLISVSGDSMEPFVSSGEMVIVERTHEAKNNEIVIANINGEIYVKKLQRDPFGKRVKLISANPLYIDIELKEDELEYLKIVGVVRAKIRPF